MHSDWLKLATWIAASNQRALFQRRVVTLLDKSLPKPSPGTNNVLWLVKTGHVNCSIQSECFISEKSCYFASQKFTQIFPGHK